MRARGLVGLACLLAGACAEPVAAPSPFAGIVLAATAAAPTTLELKGRGGLPGKVVPVWVQRGLVPEEVLAALPEERRATGEADARAVARIDCRSAALGAYSDGVPAYRSVCVVEVRAWPGLAPLARETFAGKVPPRVQEEGRFSSMTPPDYAAIAEWLKALPLK